MNTVDLYENIMRLDNGQQEYDMLMKRLQQTSLLSEKLDVVKNTVADFAVLRRDSKSLITKHIIEYMLQNKGSLRLEKLSERMGYTAYYLNKVFHAHTGYTIGKYHGLLRVHDLLNTYERSRSNHICPEQSKLAIHLAIAIRHI